MSLKKLLLAFSLCLITVLFLFAFDNGMLYMFRAEKLHGSWLTDVPAAEQIEASLAQLGIVYDIPDDLQMVYEFQFKDDGTVVITIDENAARNIAAAEEEALRATLPDLFYAQYGNDKEALDAQLASEGLTIELFVENILEEMHLEESYLASTFIASQHYFVKNGKIYFAASQVDLEAGNYDMTVDAQISGTTLTLSNAIDGTGAPYEGTGNIKYPLSLRRK